MTHTGSGTTLLSICFLRISGGNGFAATGDKDRQDMKSHQVNTSVFRAADTDESVLNSNTYIIS